MGIVKSAMLVVPTVLAGICISNSALAAPTDGINAQQITYSVYNNGTIVPDTTIVSHDLATPLSWGYPGTLYGTAIASAPGIPVVSVTAGSPAGPYFNSVHVRAALAYYILINGPNNDFDVPVLFSSYLTVTASGTGLANFYGSASASAQFTLQEYKNDSNLTYLSSTFSQELDAQTNSSQYETKSVNILGTALVSPGTYLVPIIAAEVAVTNGGSGSAYADPYFVIDPSFSAAHPGYSLSFAPFVGNDAPSAAVPEPATWAMMILGFGMVGGALRRRSSTLSHSPLTI